MKKQPALFFCALICIITSFSCNVDDNNTSLTVRESDQYFLMKAHFNKSKTRNVEEYMDNRIGKAGNMSFVNSQIDGTLSLDDHTTFYIKKYPGFLEIKLDKNRNSGEAYLKIKSMCEGIKKGLTN